MERSMDDMRRDDERDQRIREIAYFLWQEEGCPDDSADRHWAAAEAVVNAEDQQRDNGRGDARGEPLGTSPDTAYVEPTPLATQMRAPRAARR
jgi:hypothetical protein